MISIHKLSGISGVSSYIDPVFKSLKEEYGNRIVSFTKSNLMSNRYVEYELVYLDADGMIKTKEWKEDCFLAFINPDYHIPYTVVGVIKKCLEIKPKEEIKRVKCGNCGGDEIKKKDDIWICSYCNGVYVG